MISFGPRSALGLFLTPMSKPTAGAATCSRSRSRSQNLLWGVGQPFAGALADRFGMVRVLIAGALLYAAGIVHDGACRRTPGMLYLSAGVLIGFGLSGCSFNLVIGAFGKLLPESWRSLRLRRRHGGRLVRPVPVLAARRRR